VAARLDPAAIVEQTLADVPPDHFRPIKADRVNPLDLDAAGAPSALDPKGFAGNL